ncbi:MAG: carbohydrate porin, partial [Candidatus Omnitrophica bacterium]|nr:carbohydrate porin [Candidatus Omnitrophota bacterium]
MKKISVAALLTIFLICPCAFAQGDVNLPAAPHNFSQQLKSWWNGEYFLGNWNGARQKLAEQGIDIVSTYVIDLLTNVSGGEKKRRFAYDYSLGLDINADLEKIFGLEGLQFHVSGVYRQGRNISDYIGNRFPPSSIYGSEYAQLYNLYLEQSMFNNKASIKVGRLGAGDDFAQSPLYWIFLTNSIDGCPINLPINFFFSVYPNAVWGARLKVNPVSAFAWKGGIYNQDASVKLKDAHGADLSWRSNKGLLFIQEFSFLPNQYKEAKGLPGNYKLGLFYSTGRFNDLYQDENGNSAALTGLSQKRRYGNYGLYFHADQMLYREPGSNDQGFTPFLAVVLQPPDVNEIPFFIDAALTYKGLLPGRGQDVTGIAVAYGQWSRRLNKYQDESGKQPQKYEMVIETTYKLAVNQWLYIQPDIQNIMNPP